MLTEWVRGIVGPRARRLYDRRAGLRFPRLCVEALEDRLAPAGLVAAYSFDAGTGSTVADASGNGNTGTIVNTTWTTAGTYGDALSFNGTNARVDINDAASLHLTTAMTLEAWVNPSAVSSAWRDLVYKGNDNYYLMATTDHSSLPGGGIIAGGTYAETFGTTILATNTWTHLATTYDGATLRLYVNGVQVSSVAKTGIILTSTNPLQLGGDSIYGQYFQGLIDEVRVYNVALTAAQIQADMNTPITPDTQPPTAPTNLMAAAGGAGQINLSWTASTDNVGVTGYLVERQDPGSTTFVQIGTTTATTYNDTGLAANSTYSYRVRAADAAGNLSPYSNVASATTAATMPGLAAAYSFDAGAGSTVADASGNGNTGTIVNATWTTAGKYGNALSFNGTNARVNINDAASLHLTTAMTLEAWVNPSVASSAWRDVVYKGNDNYYLMATTDHSSLPGGGIIAAGTYAETFGTTILATNTWTHLATTYDGATLRLYVNGVQVSSVAKTGNIVTSTNLLQLGGDSIYGQYFQGLIDEVRVYNAALTAAQVQADMNTPITQDTQPPTAPTNLTVTASSNTITLNWTASTDNVGVTGYLVERQDPGSTTFAQIGTTTATTYTETGLAANSTYSYRVRATDAAGNLSDYSNVASATTSAGNAAPLLHISPNGRYFLDSNDQPFYLVGDTAWALPAGLTLSQATTYFQTRASQGFNTVLMDADLQMGASPVGAPVRGPNDAYGNLPFNGYLPGTSYFDVSTVPAPGDTTSTAAKYWQNIDNIITAAAQNGIEIMLDVYDNYNPWFGFQSSPNSAAKLTAYGQFLGQRYANTDNIIWMLGNDYSENPGGDASLTAVIQGIRQYDSRHLGWALDEYGATFDNTGLRQYLQLNSVYEYSAGPWRSLYLSQYNRSDFGPTFNVESGYEYNTSLGVTEADVRNEHYSFLLNGATGDMYGNEYVWPFASSWQDWQAALTSEGGREMTYLANLVNSIPWYNLIPDQNGTVFQAVGSPTDYSGAYTSDGTLALAYQPATGTTSQSFLVNMGMFVRSVTAQWYDPTNGTYTTIGTFANSGTHTFNSPSSNSAGQNDFVLVLGGPLPQRTFAVPSAVSADAPPPLTIAELQSVIPAAIAEWQIAGADASQVQALQNAQFEIADLPTTYLGWTFGPVTGDPAHPGQVVIDRTAQGFGWFIDAGPAGDAGFTLQVAPTERHAPAGSPPSKRFDLLTVVAHELGHILGLPDILDEANHPGDLMDQTLNPGVRRLIAAESLVNTAPLASSPAADGLDNGAVSAPALAGSRALATPVSHQETAPSASAILFEQWWQAGFLSPNFAARAASAALPNVPASLHEAPALLPPPDRVAALAEQTSSGFPSQVETRCTAAERASLLLAMAESRPAFDEWGNELCNCLTAR